MSVRRDRPIQIYALLFELERARSNPEPCKHYDLECYLHSNWQSIDALVKHAMEKGWVKFTASNRSYEITEEGLRYLADLKRVLDLAYSKPVRSFLRRKYRQED